MDNKIIISNETNCLSDNANQIIRDLISEDSERKSCYLLKQMLKGTISLSELRKIIKPEIIYEAVIPKQLEAGMKNGILDFMKDSITGENIGHMVNQKHRTQGIVRVRQRTLSLTSVSSCMNLIASIEQQQQLMSLTETINEVRIQLYAIRESYDCTVFGNIEGASNQLIQMRDVINPDIRTHLLTQAITTLNNCKGVLAKNITTQLEIMPRVPFDDIMVCWEIIKDKSYLSKVTEAYNKIEQYMNYYVTTIQLLGYAYAFANEPIAFNDVFIPDATIVNNVNLSKLKATEYLYEEPFGKTWYKNPEVFLNRIRESVINICDCNSPVIECKISGQMLMEVMANG